jgi:propionyl-CoA carboxylase alpha chain
MFTKILIANRGEIAVRIIRTARQMGIATVAVYCDSDADALHVEMADEAVNIGPPPATTSYLVIDRIIDACRHTGADAVHPGYGFLSEQAEFVEALAAKGIAFIGPNAKAIAAMGDKIESKKLAAEAGVATVPGHLGIIESEAEAVAVAGEVGLPVMIKASAGGGGKGMRIARNLEEVSEGFARARSEAAASFGDDRVFIERFVERPRHIEIQVLADKHGNIVHLGERECSIQRRNQKIVEEAPSPAIDAQLREEMGAQAIALAKAVEYDSAGTVEFIFSNDDRSFYFLEMNTRLQVEHPVTELTTGIDIVEQMIRVASGEELAITQGTIGFDGWALETRLYAEDSYREFLPSIGRLNTYRVPKEGSVDGRTIRIDSGVAEGSEVSIHFDPLIAKLVTHGSDREAAVDAMAELLDRVVIDGLNHNQPFLSALMDHPRWRRGELSTAFIDEEYQGNFKGIEPEDNLLNYLAMVAMSIELDGRNRLASLAGRLDGAVSIGQEDWVVVIGATTVPVKVSAVRSASPTDIDLLAPAFDIPVTVTSDWRPGERIWSGIIDGAPMVVQLRSVTGGVRLMHRGVDVVARVMTPRLAALAARMPEKVAADFSKLVRCPMPGLVVAINVVEGQQVQAGEAVAIIEAMKMENVLRAERDAIVAKVNANAGDILAVDAVILEFE